MNSDGQWYTAQRGDPGFEFIGRLTPSVWSCMFCVGLLLPQCKDMHAQLIGGSKLAVDVYMSMNCCLSVCVSLKWGTHWTSYHLLSYES